MKFAIIALSLFALTITAQAQEKTIRLGPGNTPPGLFKPKPNPPPPEFKGKCAAPPCGVKPVPFKPVVTKPVVKKPDFNRLFVRPVVRKPVPKRP